MCVSIEHLLITLAALIMLPGTLAAASINVAATANGGIASQSSQYQTNGDPGQWLPYWAIDGNTDGYRVAHVGTLQHTEFETNAWWQVMFNADYSLSSVTIYNRLDMVWDRINLFSVFLLNGNGNPFATVASGQSFADGQQATWTSPIADVVAHGLRVQLDGTNYLHMTQVEVMGDPVPEPTTMVLMGAGLMGLGILRQRR